jgi:putative AdoMet-dependent methyltransferase
MKQNVGIDFAEEAGIHIKDEYSTFDWIIEEMLHKSVFKFDILHKDDFIAVYYCKKEKASQSPDSTHMKRISA